MQLISSSVFVQLVWPFPVLKCVVSHDVAHVLCTWKIYCISDFRLCDKAT